MSIFRICAAAMAASTCFLLAYLSYPKNKHVLSNKYFSWMNVSLGFWNIGDVAMFYAPGHEIKLFMDRLSYFWAILVVPCLILLVISMTQIIVSSRILRLYYVSTIILLALVFTPLIIKDTTITNRIIEKPGILYPLFIISLLFGLSYAIARFFMAYRNVAGYKRNQLKFMYFGSFFAFLGAVNYFISMYRPQFPALYYFLEVSYLLFVGYAIIRYRLMDFNLLVRRSLAYGTLVMVLGVSSAMVVIYTERASNQFIGGLRGVPTLIMAVILVAVYDPVRKKINSFVDRFLFHSPDLDMTLQQFGRIFFESKGVKSLSANLSVRLKGVWQAEHAGLALWDPKKGQYIAHPSSVFDGKFINKLKRYRLDDRNFLVKNLKYERRIFKDGIVVVDEAKALANRSYPGERMTFLKVRRTMRFLGAELCAPIMSGEELLGFLVLGPKNNKTIYNREERKLIAEICRMVASAIKDTVKGPVYAEENLLFGD